jgi:hypothetical protein
LKEGAKNVPFEDVPALIQTASYYIDKVGQRDIFKIGLKKSTEDTAKAAPISAAKEMTQHLKLVGISWSNDPDAMVEDSKALRTFFVKRGHKIGGVKVEAIFKDKLILSYEGEEVELR